MRSIILASLVALAAPATATASLDFETGDTSGWVSSGITGAGTGYGAFAPNSGSYLGYVVAGDAWVYSTLTRIFNLTAGANIHGVVGFQAGDYWPYDDDAYLSVNGTNIWTSSVGAVGDYGNSGWVPFSFTAPTAGAYSFELGVRNAYDSGFSSGAVIDYGAVPEPATWIMMIAGFGMVGFAARGRQTGIASVSA
jgi:hypothetical protein